MSEEKPDLTDEMAEGLDDISAEVQNETRPEPDEMEQPPEQIEVDGDSLTVGHMVGNVYALSANIATENYGSGEPIFEKSDGSLDTSVVEQLQIPQYVDQLMAKRSMDELTPEQALVLSSAIFAGIVLMSDTELITGLSGSDEMEFEQPEQAENEENDNE